MLTNLRIDTRTRSIVNLPNEWKTIFLARIHTFSPFLFVALVGPNNSFLSEGNPIRKFANEVKVVFFTAENLRVYDVHYGEKHFEEKHCGGVVNFDYTSPQEKQVLWFKPYTITTLNKYKIPDADVLICE